MGFVISCSSENCLSGKIPLKDGYNNEGFITLKIVGEQTIKVDCEFCGRSIMVIDGKLV